MRAILRDLAAAGFYATLGLLIFAGLISAITLVRHPLVRYAVDQALSGDVEAIVTPHRR